jgi:hypothetical protein
VDPFIDPEGYRAFIDAAEAQMSAGRLRSTRRLRSRSVPCSGYREVASLLVAVRGYEKGCSRENVEFVGIAA